MSQVDQIHPPAGETVANLNSLIGIITIPEGTETLATDGRKIGEGAAAGTGVRVYFSLGAWRVLSSDAPVQS